MTVAKTAVNANAVTEAFAHLGQVSLQFSYDNLFGKTTGNSTAKQLLAVHWARPHTGKAAGGSGIEVG